MVEAGRSQSRGKNRPIDPSFDNSPYLSSPIRPIASSTTTSGKKNRAQSSTNKSQTQMQCQDDGIAPLRDITVSSKSPTSLLRSTSRSRSALSHDADDAEADADDGCSLANSTICTTRTAAKGNAPRKSPYLMGSTGTKRVGRGAATTTSKVSAAAKKKPPPKLLLMPDEVDEMLLVFKQQQHEEGRMLFNNNTDGDDGGSDGDDADEEYSSAEEDDESSSSSALT